MHTDLTHIQYTHYNFYNISSIKQHIYTKAKIWSSISKQTLHWAQQQFTFQTQSKLVQLPVNNKRTFYLFWQIKSVLYNTKILKLVLNLIKQQKYVKLTQQFKFRLNLHNVHTFTHTQPQQKYFHTWLLLLVVSHWRHSPR